MPLAVALLTTSFAHAEPPPGYVLAWSDEFDGSSLDLTKWNYRQLGPRHDAINTADAVTVGGGMLTISTYTEGGTHYTGMIGTENLYMPRYGYFEARINFNESHGSWSAFWMQAPTMGILGDPQNNGTEIDIVEHRYANGNNVRIHNRAVSNIHWDGYEDAHKQTGSGLVGANLSTGWHLFALEWTSNVQNFYYDGEFVWGITNSTSQNPIPPEAPVSQRSQYMILSSEVRNNAWAGIIPVAGYGTRATSNTRMNVDYVRHYTYAPIAPEMSAINLGANQSGIFFHGSPGVSYVLEQSSDLQNWTAVATNIAPASGLMTYTNSVTGPAAYYRARTE